MNIQGDEPEVSIKDLNSLNDKMKSNHSKIGTLAAKILNSEIYKNENIVKVKVDKSFEEENFPYAEMFYRKDESKKNIYHHIGVYCYEVETLKNFVTLKQSKNEIKNRLEQLRALDNNIKINVAKANHSPIGVDTFQDYLDIKKIMEYK